MQIILRCNAKDETPSYAGDEWQDEVRKMMLGFAPAVVQFCHIQSDLVGYDTAEEIYGDRRNDRRNH